MAGRSRRTEIETLSKDKKTNLLKGNHKEVANVCNYLGSLLMQDEQYEDAISEHETELEMCQKIGDVLGIAIASRKIGECYCALDNFDEALVFQKRHLSLARSLDNSIEEQRAQATIGRTYLCKAGMDDDDRDVLKNAEDAFNESLRIALSLKADSVAEPREFAAMIGRLHLNLGIVSEMSGDLKNAISQVLRAKKTIQGHGLSEDEEKCASMLGGLYQKTGDFSAADEMAETAYHWLKKNKLKNRSGVTDNLLLRAGILLERKKFLQSRHFLKRVAKTNISDAEQKTKALTMLRLLSRIKSALAKIQHPECSVVEKMKLYEAVADDYSTAECYFSGLFYYKEMLKLSEKSNRPDCELAAIYVSLAQTCADLKFYREAMSYALKETKHRADPGELCRTWLNIADYAYHCNEENGFIVDMYNSALTEAEKSGNHSSIARSLRALQEFYRSIDDEVSCKELEERITAIGTVLDEDAEPEDPNRPGPLSVDELSSCTESEDDQDGTPTTVTKRRVGFKVRRNEKGETQLHVAVINGNFKLVKRLIEKGHPVNERDAAGWLPIHEAANHNHLDIAIYLIEHNALIDDMGNGKERNDLTPILDAAHSGNLDMVSLLQNRGANVTCRDGQGNTIVDALLDWKREYYRDGFGEDDEQTGDKFELLIAEVQAAMITAGMRPDQLRRTRNSGGEDGSTKKAGHGQAKLGFSEEDGLRELDSAETTSGATAYRNAMDSLRSAAYRKRKEPSRRHPSPASKVARREALIPVDDFVGDDWLQEDTVSTTVPHRPTADVADLFITSGLRKSRQSGKMKVSRKVDVVDVDDTESYHSERSDKRKRCVVDDDTSTDDDNDIVTVSVHGLDSFEGGLLPSLSAVSSSGSPGVRSSPSCLRNRESPVPARTDLAPPVRERSTPVNVFLPPAVRRVKVRIGTHLINVPLGSVPDRSIGWLNEEAAVRYQQECENLKPQLQLRTIDGAILSANDKISDVLNEFEEVVGVPLSWNVPPIADRYTEAARSKNGVVYDNVLRLLTRASETGKLSLNDLSLDQTSIAPVCRALRHETNLKMINLEANRLGDRGFKLVIDVLEKLPMVSSLSLSCTDLSSTSVRELAQHTALRSAPTEKLLPALTELDLSYNAFCDDDIEDICSFVTELRKLVKLNLTDCGFSVEGLERILTQFPSLHLT